MKSSKKTPAMVSRCRLFGMCGTALGHCAVALVLCGAMQQANSMPLPLPMESQIIALHVSPAKQLPPPTASSASPLPEPKPEIAPKPEVPLKPEAMPEPAAPKALQGKKPSQEKRSLPQTSTKKTEPPRQALPAGATDSSAQQTAMEQAVAQARQTLLSYLVAQIEKHKRYPNAARKLGLEGVVHIAVNIDASGKILSYRLEQGNAHPMLQKAATTSMEKVQAHWQPHPTPKAISIVIPLRYSLVGG